MTLEDDWAKRGGSVYAGKIYSYFKRPNQPSDFRATEILTMGFERFLADPIGFYRDDPDWFTFVVETLCKP